MQMPGGVPGGWSGQELNETLEFRFQNLPFSKSAGKKCAVFVRTGGLSVTFFTVFKMCRHRVNAVLVSQAFLHYFDRVFVQLSKT